MSYPIPAIMDKRKLLQRMGLTEYESRAYLSLAKLGPSTVREIVLDSKLPRSKTYEALQKLEDQNKAVALPGSPKRYKITNHELLKEEIKDMADSMNSLIKKIETPRGTEYKDLFWVIKGRKPLIEKFTIENQKAEKEIFSCSELNKMLYKNMRIIKERTERGVKVRFITLFDKRNMKYYRAWLRVGAKIRVFDEEKLGLLPRITVQDGVLGRITVGLPEVKKEEEYVTLWTDSIAFCNMLRNQFMHMWKSSQPIEKLMKS
ncbi:TrmB family transcriptional regulator [Nanoarchaeota archaeon]